jgi:hypothetical protein
VTSGATINFLMPRSSPHAPPNAPVTASGSGSWRSTPRGWTGTTTGVFNHDPSMSSCRLPRRCSSLGQDALAPVRSAASGCALHSVGGGTPVFWQALCNGLPDGVSVQGHLPPAKPGACTHKPRAFGNRHRCRGRSATNREAQCVPS